MSVLAIISKFQSFRYKTKEKNKNFQLDSNTFILESPEPDRGTCWSHVNVSVAFLRVRRINIEMNLKFKKKHVDFFGGKQNEDLFLSSF